MKIRHLYYIASVLMLFSCQDSNQSYIRRAIKIMDRQGLFAEGPEWTAAKQSALASEPASLEEAQDIVRSAAKIAGGKHSFLMTSSDVKEYEASEQAMPSLTIGEDGIAVVVIPRFSGTREEGIKYASVVVDSIPDSLKGVVIDLRDNTGGNMYPMIAAVHRFLPDDNVLQFRTRKRQQWIPLSFAVNGTGLQQKERIECPVAILTNELTASSGEATLICFRGLDYVRVFGSPTAGYASANQTYPMQDGSELVLTVGCDVARTGEIFCDDPIQPDQTTETPLEDALEWLRGKDSLQGCPAGPTS